MSKLIEFVQRVFLFIRLMVGATRSNHSHSRMNGRPKQSWLGAIPEQKVWPTLWGITHRYGQMDAYICREVWYSVNEEESESEWHVIDVEGDRISVFMATKEWRNQGASPGITQWNPHHHTNGGYFLCFSLDGVVLPLPWLWGSIIPHPSNLLGDIDDVAKANRLWREEEERIFLQKKAVREGGRPARVSRQLPF